MSKIIALAGRKGSGKSEISSRLINDGYIKFSFADWMKQSLSDFFKIDIDYFYNQKYKEASLKDIGLEPIVWNEKLAKKFSIFIKEDFDTTKTATISSLRQLMQFVGTDLLRAKDDAFHVKKALSNIDKNKKYVCDDLRFKNEHQYLSSLGDEIKSFYITRPFNWSNISNHASEISLKWNNFSQIIFNIQDNVSDFIKDNYNNLLNNNCLFINDNKFNLNAFSSYDDILSEHLIIAYLHKTKQLGLNFINQILKFDKITSFNWINCVYPNFYMSHKEIENNLSFAFSKEDRSSLLLLENLKIWNDSSFLKENLPFDLKDEYISELTDFSTYN